MSYLRDRYINPLTDFGFKRIFGTEANKALAIAFLNTLLPPHHQIQDLTYKNTENLGNTPLDRKAILPVSLSKTNPRKVTGIINSLLFIPSAFSISSLLTINRIRISFMLCN